jgi:hypothetical protein
MLKQKLKTLSYRAEIKSNPTVTIGFCEVQTDCALTNVEIYQQSEKAKNFAKKSGGESKNGIAFGDLETEQRNLI